MNLFLDDERFPPADGQLWHIVRDMPQAVALIAEHGCPKFISFDHDLGGDNATGYDFAHWLVNKDLDMDGDFIPTDFSYYVHSLNTVGKKNIIALIDGYLGQR